MPNYTIDIYLNNKTFKESNKEYTFFLHGGDIPIIRLEELSLIAKVHLDDVEEVKNNEDIQDFLHFVYSICQNRYFQNSQELWFERSEVEMLTNEPQRSTSIGDIFKWNGHFYMVAPLGFVEIYPQER